MAPRRLRSHTTPRGNVVTILVFLCLVEVVVVRTYYSYVLASVIASATTGDRTVDGPQSSSSSQYTWMGNQFIPPRGVPTYGPLDYLSYFGRTNTLFVGDSTGRRAYATLIAAMTSDDPANVAMSALGPEAMNAHKTLYLEKRCPIEERRARYGDKYWCRDLPKVAGEERETARAGRFDFFWAPCMKDVAEACATHTPSMQQDYDLVVAVLGVWDVLEFTDEKCRMTAPRRNDTNGTDSTATLMAHGEKHEWAVRALSAVSSPELHVVYRTPGFNAGSEGTEELLRQTQHVKEYAARPTAGKDGEGVARAGTSEGPTRLGGANFTVVDWGTVVSKRSFAADRIAGDNPAHYGLEARLLFAQQLLHHLLASK